MQQELRARFNGLQSIEVADDLMRKGDALRLAFSTLYPIFLEHDMCDKWGICLLHNHWLLEENELAIQDVEQLIDRRRYTTVPRAREFSKAFWPSVLSVAQYDDSYLLPLEYSTDISAAIGNQSLEFRHEFSKDIIENLNKNDLSGIFGLIYLKIPSVSDLDFLEVTFSGRVTIVDEVRLQNYADTKIIPTAWRFMREEASIGCAASCFQRCVVKGDTHEDEGHTPVHGPDGC